MSAAQTYDFETKLFINNEYVNSKSARTLEVRNPVDDSLVSSDVQVADAADVDLAVAAANAAFKGSWGSLTGHERGELMIKFANLFEEHSKKFCFLETIAMGMPISVIQVFAALVPRYFRYYAGYADKLEGDAYPADDGVYKFVQYEPLGVCASVASWNATPLYLAWKIAPALATGNTVIFKASEKSPLGALALGDLFCKAGFPPGVVNFVTGAGETGHLLASHMGIRKISFTGSAAVGRKIQEAATKSNLKRVTLELGGKSPAIVFDDADIENALAHCTQGFLLNSGQICAAASRTYVHESIASTFIAALTSRYEAASQTLGKPSLDVSTSLGPVADKIQFDRVMSFIDHGKRDAELIVGGKRKGDKGWFVEPTIFFNPKKGSKIYQEEIFGPVLVVKTFKTEEEVIDLANDTEYGLSACIYTKDIGRALRVSTSLQTGAIAVNSAFMPNPSTAFGGFKQSGNGARESGKYALKDYLEAKTIHIQL